MNRRYTMTEKKNQFTSDNQPSKRTPRSRGNKVLFLEMLREESELELTENSTQADAEKAFFKHVWERAKNPEDTASGTCLTLLGNKCWSTLKPSNDVVNFEFDESLNQLEQAAQVLKAISTGELAPDIGNTIIASITATIKIEEITEVVERINRIEKALNGES